MKDKWEKRQCFVGIVGIFAALVIAWFAYDIQEKIQATTLFHGYSDSAFISELRKKSNIIDYEIYKTRHVRDKMKITRDEQLVMMFRINAELSGDELKKIRSHVSEMLKMIFVLNSCMVDYRDQDFSQMIGSAFRIVFGQMYCQKDTIMLLFGDALVELFFNFSPVLYCDEYIQSQYAYQAKKGKLNYVEKWEKFVELYYTKYAEVPRKVFRQKTDVDEEQKKYIVLQISTQYCAHYPNSGA